MKNAYKSQSTGLSLTLGKILVNWYNEHCVGPRLDFMWKVQVVWLTLEKEWIKMTGPCCHLAYGTELRQASTVLTFSYTNLLKLQGLTWLSGLCNHLSMTSVLIVKFYNLNTPLLSTERAQKAIQWGSGHLGFWYWVTMGHVLVQLLSSFLISQPFWSQFSL